MLNRPSGETLVLYKGQESVVVELNGASEKLYRGKGYSPREEITSRTVPPVPSPVKEKSSDRKMPTEDPKE